MSTQWIRTLRTSLQALAGFLPVVPTLVGALGIGSTVGVGAIVIGVAATLTRIMMIPEVDEWINGKLGRSN